MSCVFSPYGLSTCTRLSYNKSGQRDSEGKAVKGGENFREGIVNNIRCQIIYLMESSHYIWHFTVYCNHTLRVAAPSSDSQQLFSFLWNIIKIYFLALVFFKWQTELTKTSTLPDSFIYGDFFLCGPIVSSNSLAFLKELGLSITKGCRISRCSMYSTSLP